jgi:hypothetical protein
MSVTLKPIFTLSGELRADDRRKMSEPEFLEPNRFASEVREPQIKF